MDRFVQQDDYCAEMKGLIPDSSHITLIHFQPKFKSKGFYASRYVVKKPRGHSRPHPPVNQVMTIFKITVHLVASMKWSEVKYRILAQAQVGIYGKKHGTILIPKFQSIIKYNIGMAWNGGKN